MKSSSEIRRKQHIGMRVDCHVTDMEGTRTWRGYQETDDMVDNSETKTYRRQERWETGLTRKR